jgi:hypothetical protein
VSEEPELSGWRRFIGGWETDGSHPLLPGEVIRGTSTFEWLDGERFVIWRAHYEHPKIPDAITIVGITDGRLSMHYFDCRGVHRVYSASLHGDTWRYWRDAGPPDLSQRFTGTFSEDGGTIIVHGQMSRDGSAWEDDLALTYRKVG